MTEEKAINLTSAAGREAANGVVPVRPGRDPVLCAKRPNGQMCNMGSPGFICQFGDGTCLRHPKCERKDKQL